MMYSKGVIFSAFLIAISIAVQSSYAYGYGGPNNSDNKSHHLITGSRLPGDRVTYQENIIQASKLWRIVTVTKTFKAAGQERITHIEALDQKTNGNGAYARILNGGIGSNNVTIKFKSQRNHGIDFVVRIYSRQ